MVMPYPGTARRGTPISASPDGGYGMETHWARPLTLNRREQARLPSSSSGSRRKFGSLYTPVNPGELTLIGEGEHLHEVRHRPVRPCELAYDPDLRPFRHQLADLKLLELP